MSHGKFDLRVHIRDPKTGRVEKIQPYRLVIRNGEQRFWRGGVEFFGDGTPVNPEEAAKMKPVMTLEEKHNADAKAILKAELKSELMQELKEEAAEERRAKKLEKELKLKEETEAAELAEIEKTKAERVEDKKIELKRIEDQKIVDKKIADLKAKRLTDDKNKNKTKTRIP